LNTYYRFTFQQQLLAGFGFGPNLRYLRIAKNNKKISDIAFKNQVIATVTQVENIYWDLVSAYEQARVNEQSLAFANQTLENAKKQLQLESIPEMDVMKAEAEVSKRDQDLTVARTNLQLAGIADEECADQEPGRSHAGRNAGRADRSLADLQH
jgi:outer membrane protein TolC